MSKLVLGVDIGNTNTVFGLFNDGSGYEIIKEWRTFTRRERTSDELGVFIFGFLQSSGIKREDISGMIYSSVVPSFNNIVEKMAAEYFNCSAVAFNHTNLPLSISYPRPFEIGADRLVNAVAATTLYGDDLIVIDMGTATTFCVINDGDYQGGAIAPGLNVSIESLARSTAQLPPINFRRPECGVIGDTTMHALQSGFFYGWVGMIRNIKNEIIAAAPERKYRVIGTGGLASVLERETDDIFDEIDSHLTLRGLKIIYNHIQGAEAN